MSGFTHFCNQLSQLDDKATADLSKNLECKTFKKGAYLLRSSQVCKYLFFIDEGLAKTFFYHGDKEFIMRFFPEKSMFTVLDSHLTQTPSRFMIMALEATSITCISKEIMEELCKKHHCIETFFRRLVCIASVNMMKRVSEMLEENATERYKHFIKENNNLLQRISLGDLANYLGITQVSLSRIRAKK